MGTEHARGRAVWAGGWVVGAFALVTSCASTPGNTLASAEHFIAASAACLPGWTPGASAHYILDARGIADVISFGALQTPEAQCVLRAHGCAAVRSCFGVALMPAGPTDCPTDPLEQCQGTQLVVCYPPGYASTASPTEIGSVDCNGYGDVCTASSSTSASCTPCTSSSAACESGEVVTRCAGAVVRRDPCPGQTACMDFGGLVTCAGTGADCMHDTCVGDVLELCDTNVGRVRQSLSCADLGQHCMTGASGAGFCVPTATSCDPMNVSPDCVDGELRYCGGDGAFHRYDCAAHGLGPCSTDSFVAGCTSDDHL